MSTEEMKAPAIGATWFNLRRHDGEEGDNPPEPADGDTGGDDDDAQQMLADALDDDSSGEPDDADDDKPDDANLGEAGKKALDRMKAERAAARKEAAAAKKSAAETRKQLAEMQRKVQEFEDAKKSDLEKAQSQAERAKDQAAKAVARSVRSEIKVAASGKFADVSDATDVLMRDPGKFVDADGEIDTEAIEAELADLLDRKPHWGIPEPAPELETSKKAKPKPDPGQGSRGAPAPVDFRTASDEEYAAELAKYGVRKRY